MGVRSTRDELTRVRPYWAVVAVVLALSGCTATGERKPQEQTPASAKAGSTAQAWNNADPSTPIAIVGDSIITLGELQNRIDQSMPQFRARFKSVEGRRTLLNTMIESRLLYQEAIRRGLDKEKVLRDRLETFAEQLYGGELSRRIIKQAGVSEEEARRYYDSHKDQFRFPAQVRARHILLKTRKEADEALKEIQDGADFGELAKKKSQDTRTKAAGGELGWFSHGMMAPEFEKAAFTLPIGAISPVISTHFGFHIIDIEEKRPESISSFENEKARIVNQLRGRKQRRVFEDFKRQLRSKTEVVIRENLLKSNGGSRNQSP